MAKVTKVKKSPSQEAVKQHFSVKQIKPLTDNQQKTFDLYNEDKNIVLAGSAGTGKSFLALYLALNEVLKPNSCYKKIIIIRSAVPSREIGFVPGTLEEKSKIYQDPYVSIVNELIGRGDAWTFLFNKGIIEFSTTSFLRGVTFNDAIIVFDEFQSATFHELNTVMTRIGDNSRFILCGDFSQNDLNGKKEQSGFVNLMEILSQIKNIGIVNFTVLDVVRSGFVRSYLIAKDRLGI
jgi:phosphate starvation-inducible protein PhoH